MEHSAGEDAEASGGVGERDQTIEYIIYFTKAIE